MKQLQVVAAIIEQNGALLISQRPPEKDLGQLWEFPGGKIEPGETFSQALIRECAEELGVQITPPVFFKKLSHTYPEQTIELIFCRCQIQEGIPFGKEGQTVRWVAKEDVSQYLFCDADFDVLHELI